MGSNYNGITGNLVNQKTYDKDLLTPRWYPLRPHPAQAQYANSPFRFNVIPAGRRSGKTELFKRKLVIRANAPTYYGPGRFFAAAPTRDQAKRIYWDDLKAMVPDWMRAKKPSESDLIIYLINGAEMHVLGMDKPERAEGVPWDGGGMDEYGNMKPTAWGVHVRPALSDRSGWCDFIGVPEGRNHYYDMKKRAVADITNTYGHFTWFSSDILPAEEIEQAKLDLDELTYKQEYEGSFISFQGRCYYSFSDKNVMKDLPYKNNQPLILCFDFNVEPGTATIIQEWDVTRLRSIFGRPFPRFPRQGSVSLIIGEVHIPTNSTTEAVCRRILMDWKDHYGKVYIYGDATGGARKSSQTFGNDWDIVKAILEPHYGHNFIMRVRDGNPSERSRVNSMNSRCRSLKGIRRLFVDPCKAPNVVTDFEGVQLLVGGSGEIDKKANKKITHLTDGIGYYMEREYSIAEYSKILKVTGT